MTEFRVVLDISVLGVSQTQAIKYIDALVKNTLADSSYVKSWLASSPQDAVDLLTQARP